MADKDPEPSKKQPPKIKLSGNGNGIQKPDVPDELLSAAPGSDAPPKLKVPTPPSKPETAHVDIPSSDSGSETTKIELSKAAPSADDEDIAKSMTMRVDLSPKGEGGSETAEVDLPSDSPSMFDDAAKSQTMRVEIPQGIPSEAKSETSKIELSAAQPSESARVDPSGTSSIDVPMGIPSRAKSETQSVQMSNDEASIKEATQDINKSLEDAYRAANESTMRIELESDAAAESPTTDVAPERHRTTPIDLGEVLGNASSPDVLKRRTGKPDTGTPKTIRIQRSDFAPTRVLKRPPPPSTGAAQPGVAETAHIDLPPEVEASPIQRKTIRIKRPEGTAAAGPISIARTPGVPAPSRKRAADEDTPGVAFSVLSGIALVVTAVLIYVLVAQISGTGPGAYSSSLPWPGRII